VYVICHGYTFEKNKWYEVENVHDEINSGRLKETPNPQVEDLIIYYSGDTGESLRIKHSGFFLGNGKVRSKWGNGPIFEHDVFNIPFNYGEVINFFKKS